MDDLKESTINDLWSILMLYDNTWEYKYNLYGEVALINKSGQEIHANTIESALHAAIELCKGE